MEPELNWIDIRKKTAVHWLYMQEHEGQQHDVVIAVPDVVVEHLEIELDDVCQKNVDDTYY